MEREISADTRARISAAQIAEGTKRRAKGQRKRTKGAGTVYRRGRTWTVAFRTNGVTRYGPGFLDRDTADRFRAMTARDLDGGSAGLPKETSKAALSTLFDAVIGLRRARGRWRVVDRPGARCRRPRRPPIRPGSRAPEAG
jgi:hypothetical protein